MNELQKKKLEVAKTKQPKEDESFELRIKGTQELADSAKRLEKALDDFQEATKTTFGQFDSSGIQVAINSLKQALTQSNEQSNSQLTKFAETLISELKNVKPTTNLYPKFDVKTPTPVVKSNNIFELYNLADTDEKTSTKYYGYVDKEGKWFIMRYSTDKDKQTKCRFKAGTSDFVTAWDKRKGGGYKYLFEVKTWQ